MKLRRVQRYCTTCGKHMRRWTNTPHRPFNPRTGKETWIWWWGCINAFDDDGRRRYNPYGGQSIHDAKTIRTNPVRQRLEVLMMRQLKAGP